MKRLIAIGALVLVIAAVAAGVALAQDATPPDPDAPEATCPLGMRAEAALRGAMPAWAGPVEALEDLLGLTEDEIRAERAAGKSLVDIAAAQEVSGRELVAAILDARQAALDDLVASGDLTREQADAMYARMKEQIATMVARAESGRPAAYGRGRWAGAAMQGCEICGTPDGETSAAPMMGRGMRGAKAMGFAEDAPLPGGRWNR